VVSRRWASSYRNHPEPGAEAVPCWGYLGAFGAGVTGWVVYGCLTADIAIIVTNAVTLALLLSLVALKCGLLTRAAAGGEPARKPTDFERRQAVDNH
jgi:hypothetical protein